MTPSRNSNGECLVCRGHRCICDEVEPSLSSPMPDHARWFSVPYVDPFQAGAAVAFGLLGMAEAIKSRMRCFKCRHTGTVEIMHDGFYTERYRCDCINL